MIVHMGVCGSRIRDVSLRGAGMNEYITNVRSIHVLLMVLTGAIAAFCVSPQDSMTYLSASYEARFLEELKYTDFKNKFKGLSELWSKEYASKLRGKFAIAPYNLDVSKEFKYQSPILVVWPDNGAKIIDIKNILEKDAGIVYLVPNLDYLSNMFDDYLDDVDWLDGCLGDRNKVVSCSVPRKQGAVLLGIRVVKSEVYNSIRGVVNRVNSKLSDFEMVVELELDGEKVDYLVRDVAYVTGRLESEEYHFYDWIDDLRSKDHRLPHQKSLGRTIRNSAIKAYLMALEITGFEMGWKYIRWSDYFPELDRLIEQVGTMTPTEAADFLREKSEGSKQSVSVFGQGMDERVVYWVGPLLIMGVMLYMLSAIKASIVVAGTKEARSKVLSPWVGLSSDYISKSITVGTILIFPSVLCVVVLLQAPLEIGIYHLVGGVVVIVISVAAICAICDISKLRAAVSFTGEINEGLGQQKKSRRNGPRVR